MVDTAEINDIARLETYRPLWRSLWNRTRQASFFQTQEWLECYWRHHGDRQKLRVLIVTVAGKPVGIVPLVVKPAASRAGTVRVLTYPMDMGTYFGPVGPNPSATLYGAMRHLQASARDWDLIDLRYIDDQGVDRDRTANAMRMGHLQPYRREWMACDAVDLRGSWCDYWIRRSPSLREECRALEQQLAQAGRVAFSRHRSGCDGSEWGSQRWARRELFHDSLEWLGTLPWTGLVAPVSGAPVAPERALLHDAFHTAIKSGHADLAVLTLDGAPIALACSFQHDGVLETVSLASAPQWGAAAPQVLLSRMLRDSFERGDRLIRFGTATSPASEPWRTGVETSYRYTHYPIVAPRAQLLRLRQVLRSWVAEAPQPMAERPAAEPTRDIVKLSAT